MFTITPSNSRVDESCVIKATGLTPNKIYRIQASTEDIFSRCWRSSATFRADENGELDLSEQEVISGSYEGIDAMGLFWSMRPENKGQASSMFLAKGTAPQNIYLTFQDNTGVIAEHTLVRKVLAADVVQREINIDKVKGVLFYLQNAAKLPAVLLCGGNEGGVASQLSTAALLAEEGYVVLVLAYFNYADLAKTLYEIPLERFRDAVQWLQEQSEVDATRVAAMGRSKGAEGLLAAAAYLSDLKLKALIAIAPNSVVWQGFGKGKPKPLSSWSLDNKGLTYLSMNGKRIVGQMLVSKWLRKLHLSRFFPSLVRITFAPIYDEVKQQNEAVLQAQIPVENIQAPLLLIAGTHDKMFPSAFMGREIIQRRREHKCQFVDELCLYPKAGHQIGVPHVPTTINWVATGGSLILNLGGSSEGNAFANADAWTRIKEYLAMHL